MRYIKGELDLWLERWAKWNTVGSSLTSVMATLANLKTDREFQATPPLRDGEERTEQAVCELAKASLAAAEVIRIESGIYPKDIDGSHCRTRLARAEILGISYGQYRARLKKARSFLEAYLLRTNP